MLYALDQNIKMCSSHQHDKNCFILEQEKVSAIEHGVCEKAIITPKM